MTQQKNGNIIAIITMIFLFGMIAFVTNLAAPMGIVLKINFQFPTHLVCWETWETSLLMP